MILQVSIKESFWVSSLLTRTGAANAAKPREPNVSAERLPRFGARDAGKKRKKTNPNIAQKARASEGEDEDIVFKCFDLQRLL